MVEQSLRNHVPSIEHERLSRAMCVKDAGLNVPVKLLPTSIQQGTSLVNVDLFIVDRCHSSPDISVNLGYLMGLRLCHNSEATSQEAPALSLESEAYQHGV